MEDLIETRWTTLPIDVLILILNRVKNTDLRGQDTIAFALTCKTFLRAYTQSSNAEFYVGYIRDKLRRILSTQTTTRGTVLVFEMCAFIFSCPVLSPETKLPLIHAIQTLLNVTPPERTTRTSSFGKPSEFGGFYTLLRTSLQLPLRLTQEAAQNGERLPLSANEQAHVRSLYRHLHSHTSAVVSAFTRCEEHDVVMNLDSIEEWNPTRVVEILNSNILHFIREGIISALKTDPSENGFVPLRNAQKIVALFINILTPMNHSTQNILIRNEMSTLIHATETQSYNIRLNWLCDAYFHYAFALNPFVTFLLFIPSVCRKIAANPFDDVLGPPVISAIAATAVGFFSHSAREVYRRLPEGYIRKTLSECCTRRREEADSTLQNTSPHKAKLE